MYRLWHINITALVLVVLVVTVFRSSSGISWVVVLVNNSTAKNVEYKNQGKHVEYKNQGKHHLAGYWSNRTYFSRIVCRQTVVIVMDFAKAFDKVPHQKLLYRRLLRD